MKPLNTQIGRRTLLKGGAGAAALGALGVGVGAGRATAVPGLQLVVHENYGRMEYYRFQSDAIAWQPSVNVLLPDGYWTSGKRYPVMYLLHGGQQNFLKFDQQDDIRGLTAGRDLIVVMPDGGAAGWYSNPVNANNGNHSWEHFHIQQLIPWIDQTFRTFAEFNGRAVSGFSMGGFGALKYAAKYWGHFASVSSHSGPASLRGLGGAVVHWANVSSAAVELAGGTIYGAPNWDQARVSADNPIERLESYRGKRVFLVAGTSPDRTNPFDLFNEVGVLETQREFKGRLNAAGIGHEQYEVPGGHFVRRDLLQRDIDGVIGRLIRA